MRRILTGLLLAFIAVRPVAAFDGGLELSASCLVQVWSPDDMILAKSKKWIDERERLSYTDHGPGGRSAIQVFSKGNEPSGLTAFFKRLEVAMRERPDAARISADFFIPSETRFNVAPAKMPLGIWGGDPIAERICATAGCPPERQHGFSVRLTRASAGNPDPGLHGPRIYSYNLDRPGSPKLRLPHNPLRAQERLLLQFGDHFQVMSDFPLGEWFTLALDIVLNDVTDEGVMDNGMTSLRMYDDDGALLGQVTAENLTFRKEETWHVFGPMLADLWGGDQFADDRMPIMDTTISSRDYEMYFVDPSRDARECLVPVVVPAL